MGTLKIDILGTSFTIKSSESDEKLQKIFSYYKKITDGLIKTGALSDNLQVSIMAGIMAVEQVYIEKEKHVTQSNDTQKLIDKLDAVL